MKANRRANRRDAALIALKMFTALLAVCFAAFFAASPPALAAQLDDYAYRWPLQAEGQNAAWQFELTPEVYAALVDPELRDFAVFNADGQAVPVARSRCRCSRCRVARRRRRAATICRCGWSATTPVACACSSWMRSPARWRHRP
jgi:hypothetical protein